MNYKPPINRRMHGLLDYGLAAATMVTPIALGLNGVTRAASLLFGGSQTVVNAMTDQPYAVQRRIQFRTHGKFEKYSGPIMLLSVLLLGGLREKKARYFVLGTGLIAFANYMMTDYYSRRSNPPLPKRRDSKMLASAKNIVPRAKRVLQRA
jgi:hypothetical protein